MRSLLALAALIPASLTLLPGCPLGCGAWEGRGDTLMRSDRGDSIMLCENGGYAAMLGTSPTAIEGTFEWTDEVKASSPDTGARVFTLTADATGAYTSKELAGTWTAATLGKVELDHAHVQCADLETRAWWSAAAATVYLPKAAAFKKPATGYETAEACYAAQARGEYPEAALCEDELLVCPNGVVTYNQGQSTGGGSYGAMHGTLTVNAAPGSFFASFEGVFAASGTLTTHGVYDTTGTNLTVWHQVPVTSMSQGTTCR